MNPLREFEDALIVSRVASRYSFKYEDKETKSHKADRLAEFIRKATGVSKGVSSAIADAYVRGREVARLAIQKGWPMDGETIEGPDGTLSLSKIQDSFT